MYLQAASSEQHQTRRSHCTDWSSETSGQGIFYGMPMSIYEMVILLVRDAS